MELVYCYFSELNGLKDIGINLTSRYRFTYNKDQQRIKIEYTTNDIKNFFADKNKVDVIGIVGENGSGKSSILTEIYNQDNLDTSLYVFHDKKNDADEFSIKIGKSLTSNNENVLEKDSVLDIGYSKLLFKEDYDGHSSGMGKGFKQNIARICSTKEITSGLANMFKEDFDLYISNKIASKDLIESNHSLFNESVINAGLLDNFLIANFINNQENKKNLKAEKSDSSILIEISNKNVRILPYFDFNTDKHNRIKSINFRNQNKDKEDILASKGFYEETLTKINEKSKSEFVSKIIINIIVDLILLSDFEYDKNSVDIIIEYVILNCLFEENTPANLNQNIENEKFSIIQEPIISIMKIIASDLKEVLDCLGIIKSENVKDLTLSYKDERLGNFIKIIKDKIYLLKYFKIANKVESIDTYNKMPFSSGELQILRLIARANFYVEQIKTDEKDILLLLDEPDAMLHPNWQRVFWNEFIPLINSVTDKKIKIVFTTHSPILITDIPKLNLNILGDNVDRLSIETFGANIYSLYKNTFFLDKPIGAFALGKIEDLYDKLLGNEAITEDELEECKKMINIIGEPLIKKDLQYKLNNYLNKFKNGQNDYILAELEKEKQKIELKIKKLRGEDDKS